MTSCRGDTTSGITVAAPSQRYRQRGRRARAGTEVRWLAAYAALHGLPTSRQCGQGGQDQDVAGSGRAAMTRVVKTSRLRASVSPRSARVSVLRSSPKGQGGDGHIPRYGRSSSSSTSSPCRLASAGCRAWCTWPIGGEWRTPDDEHHDIGSPRLAETAEHHGRLRG